MRWLQAICGAVLENIFWILNSGAAKFTGGRQIYLLTRFDWCTILLLKILISKT